MNVYETMAAVECEMQQLSRHGKESTSLPGQGRVVGADDAILADKEGDTGAGVISDKNEGDGELWWASPVSLLFE
jgi:hypothetical protein